MASATGEKNLDKTRSRENEQKKKSEGEQI